MSDKYLSNIIDSSFPAGREPNRQYIGASSVGGFCDRALWYGYRYYDRIPKSAKQRRTLSIGHALESLVIDSLRDAGLDIETPSKDNAFLAVHDSEIELFQGHIDAIWVGHAIIEIKTAKDSSFRIFEKKGLRNWYPVYYAQVQSYMGMYGLFKAYVIAINKDTSELHDEEVEFNEGYYVSLREKAKAIIEMVEGPPAKIGNGNPAYFACRLCDFRKVCHG